MEDKKGEKKRYKTIASRNTKYMLKKITFGRHKFKRNCCSKQYWKDVIGII